jgi:hypothetical protein
MKKIKKIIILSILCMAAMISHAQNLVPNPSFEVYISCPTSASQIFLAVPWQGVTTNSSDYFNSCGSGGTNVPNGGGGAFQHARTGVAYSGIWAYMGCYYYREYLQVHLNSALMQDSCYLIEFYCNLNNLSSYGINKMAAAISINPISATTTGAGSTLIYSPQIVSNQFIIDTVNWIKVSGYYKALGGEEYITIGNFDTCTNTDTLHISSGFNDSYYYIDDIKVEKIISCDSTETSVNDYARSSVFKLYPNPNNGNMILDYVLPAQHSGLLEITDITGKVLNRYELKAGSDRLRINDSKLENGLYLYRIIVNSKVVKSDKLLIIK